MSISANVDAVDADISAADKLLAVATRIVGTRLLLLFVRMPILLFGLYNVSVAVLLNVPTVLIAARDARAPFDVVAARDVAVRAPDARVDVFGITERDAVAVRVAPVVAVRADVVRDETVVRDVAPERFATERAAVPDVAREDVSALFRAATTRPDAPDEARPDAVDVVTGAVRDAVPRAETPRDTLADGCCNIFNGTVPVCGSISAEINSSISAYSTGKSSS